MTGERTSQALARIDAALARIEWATGRTGEAIAAQGRKHDALRQAVSETLRDLDILIANETGEEAGL
ncbi:MAG: hypothetical protein WCY11_21280 [Novosphingobium sp.]